jgi:polyamine oxidase
MEHNKKECFSQYTTYRHILRKKFAKTTLLHTIDRVRTMNVRQLLTSAALFLLASALFDVGEARVGTTSPDSEHRRDAACNQAGTEFDVIIVGAGMAGLATAHTLLANDPNMCIKILEKGSVVGGRMKSSQFEGQFIELGANWISGGNGNTGKHPIKNMADAYGIPYYDMWMDSFDVYDGTKATPTRIKQSVWWKRFQALKKAMTCLDSEGNERYVAYYAGDIPEKDVRASTVLALCGWTPGDSVDIALEAYFFDNDYLTTPFNTTIYDFPEDSYFDFGKAENFVKGNSVSNGLQGLANSYANELGVASKITFGASVTKIDYANVASPKVTTMAGTVSKTYTTKKVVYTPSIGVLRKHEESGVFNPTLTPNSSKFPIEMGTWIKVFFKFPEAFWDKQLQWIIIGTKVRNLCSLWLNYDFVDTTTTLLPGSKMLMCGLDQDAVDKYFNTTNYSLKASDKAVLLAPLKASFGSKYKEPVVAPRITNWLGDDAFLGSWERWVFNDNLNLYDYYDFLQPRSVTNNANNRTLFFAGSGMCNRYWGFMHGAYYSGVKAARWVLNSFDGIAETPKSPCDDPNNIVNDEFGG